MRLAVRCSFHICLGASPSAEDSFLRFLLSSRMRSNPPDLTLRFFQNPAPGPESIYHLQLAACLLLLLLLR
jgi:hypothetical protein